MVTDDKTLETAKKIMTYRGALKHLRESDILELCSGNTLDRQAVNAACECLENCIKENGRITDSKALAAAKLVKQYCIEQDKNCENCVFNDTAPIESERNMCCGNSLPESWEFDDEI